MPSILPLPEPEDIFRRQEAYRSQDRYDFLTAKEYHRPTDNMAFELGGGLKNRDGVDQFHDYIFARDSVTFVLSRNPDAGVPTPSLTYFAVGNPKHFKRGDHVMVDTVDGKSAVRRIRQIDGRVLILDQGLNHLPALGGDVLKVLGTSCAGVDAKATENYHKEMRKQGIL